MSEYAFDVILSGALRVPDMPDEATARATLAYMLDCAESNLGLWPNGEPILAEVSLADDLAKPRLYAIDGDEIDPASYFQPIGQQPDAERLPLWRVTARYSDGEYWGDDVRAAGRSAAIVAACDAMVDAGEIDRNGIEIVDCDPVDHVADAAPELLAALEKALVIMKREDDRGHLETIGKSVIALAESTISKARGE